MIPPQEPDNGRNLNLGHIIEQSRTAVNRGRAPVQKAVPSTSYVKEPVLVEASPDLWLRIRLVITTLGLSAAIAWIFYAEYRLSRLEARLSTAELSAELTGMSLNGLDYISVQIADIRQHLGMDGMTSEAIMREQTATPTSPTNQTAAPATESTATETAAIASTEELSPADEAIPEETDAPPAPSAASSTGKWFINIATLSSQTSAMRLQRQIGTLGQQASVEPVAIDGRQLYRLRIHGFKSRNLAEREALRLQIALDLADVWVAAQ